MFIQPLIALISLVIGAQARPTYYITSPDVLRYNVSEQVWITLFQVDNVRIKFYIQDYPKRLKTFSQIEGVFKKDIPSPVPVKVTPADLPVSSQPVKHVYLVAESVDPKLKFKNEAVILVSHQSGYMFIQTDKPIYTPDQEVKIRIIPLNQEMMSDMVNPTVRLVIVNPNNIIVREDTFKETKQFIYETFKFPSHPQIGNWTVRVHYGYKLILNSTVVFEVKKYILPTFSVKIYAPKFILPETKKILGNVQVRYVYGKDLDGSVHFKYGIKTSDQFKIFGKQKQKVQKGTGPIDISTQFIKDIGPDFWFKEGARFYVEAEVIEGATGHREIAKDISGVFVKTPYIFSYERSSIYFKPGLPYHAKVDLSYANGEVASGVPIEVIAIAVNEKNEEVNVLGEDNDPLNINTSPNGRAEFRLETGKNAKLLKIQIRTLKKGNHQYPEAIMNKILQPHQSPSKSYILVRILKEDLKVPGNVDAEALATSHGDISQLNWLVVSKGTIVASQTLMKNDGFGVSTSLRINLNYKMVPSAKLIVYYIRSDGEVVSDSTVLDIQDTCENKVSIISPKTTYKPGRTTTLEVKGKPNTLVGLLMVDKAVYLLNDKDRLTSDKMYKRMDAYDTGCSSGGGLNSQGVFKDAGIAVITNSNVKSVKRDQLKCKKTSVIRKKRSAKSITKSDWDDSAFCCSKGKEVSRHKCIDHLKGLPSNVSATCRNEFLSCCTTNRTKSGIRGRIGGDGDKGGDSFYSFEDIDLDADIGVRTNFPESTLWEDVEIGDNGVATVDHTFDGSITTWILQGVGISSKAAMCVAEQVNITVFQPFFIQLRLPYEAVRGEQLILEATVYNYKDEKLPVKMFLNGVKGVCSGAREGERSSPVKLKVNAEGAYTVYFPIVPLEVGSFPIKVTAYTPEGGDAIEKILRVVAEGVTREKTYSIILDPTNELKYRGKRLASKLNRGGDLKQKIEIVDQNQKTQVNIVDAKPPVEAIPGTPSCSVYVTGSLLGPTVQAVLYGTDSLLRLPTGCGEQTMLSLGPTVFSTAYLNRNGTITAEIEAKAYNFIKQGIAREITFRQPGGGFAVWTTGYKPSTWLTAFVLKTFCQAEAFVKIPDPAIKPSGLRWLATQQRDGRFVENYKVHHREMTGGVQGDVSLTAYVLISFYECNYHSQEVKFAMKSALTYLELELPNIKRPYAVAITAYALALGKSTKAAAAALAKLKSLSLYDKDEDLRSWGVDQSAFKNGQKPYWYQKNPSAISIETTSYALLALMEGSDMGSSNSVVRWLIKQSKKSGGFISTQDTVIALQALSEYTVRTEKTPLDLRSIVTSGVDAKFKRQLHIKQDNALILQAVDNAPTGGDLIIDTKGDGIGQAKVVMRYNQLDTKGEKCKFSVTVKTATDIPDKGPINGVRKEGEILQRGDAIGKSRMNHQAPPAGRIGGDDPNSGASNMIINLHICTRYLKAGGKTGMAILDVGLFTGFKAITEDLDSLVKNKNHIPRVNRYELSKRSVILYLEQIGSDKNYCLNLRAERENIVGNTQPVAVKVYDYYEPDETCTAFYHPENGSPLLSTICQNRVCRCAEAKCAECYGPGKTFLNSKKMKRLACDAKKNMDYAFKVKVAKMKMINGFEEITMVVQQVIKKGADDVYFEKEIPFLKKATCVCPMFSPNKFYLIMGSEGQKYIDEDGLPRYKYSIDDTSYVIEWFKKGDKRLKRRREKKIPKYLVSFVKKMKKGCDT